MSRYVLMPVEDGGSPVTLPLPDGLLVNDLFDELKKEVADKERLGNIIKQMALNDISEYQDGNIALKNSKVLNINYRNAIIDICNNRFIEKYEEFYEFLRNFDIVF